jgi:hypothetical protein
MKHKEMTEVPLFF